LSVRYFNKDAI